jgi:hypothetical protein
VEVVQVAVEEVLIVVLMEVMVAMEVEVFT